MRHVSTRVLPVPAPASTRTGPSSVSTASRCSGLRPERYCGVAVARARAAIPPGAGWWSGTPRSISLFGSVMMRIVSGPRCHRGPIKGSLEQDKPPYRAFAAVLTQLIVICPEPCESCRGLVPAAGGNCASGDGAPGRNLCSEFRLVLQECAASSVAWRSKDRIEDRGSDHAWLGRYIFNHRVDRRHPGLRRHRRRFHRDRQDHLLYRRRAVPGIGRGWPCPRAHPGLTTGSSAGGFGARARSVARSTPPLRCTFLVTIIGRRAGGPNRLETGGNPEGNPQFHCT